jgi:hypothetical protein
MKRNSFDFLDDGGLDGSVDVVEESVPVVSLVVVSCVPGRRLFEGGGGDGDVAVVGFGRHYRDGGSFVFVVTIFASHVGIVFTP